VLTVTADLIVRDGFEPVVEIMERQFPTAPDVFVDCVNCLAAFARNKLHYSIWHACPPLVCACVADGRPVCSNRALQKLRFCAAQLAEKDVCGVQSKEGAAFADTDTHIRMWFPILTGIQTVIGDRRLEVRTEYVWLCLSLSVGLSLSVLLTGDRARRLLLDILRSYGGLFSGGLWRLIFAGVVMPIFEPVRSGENLLTREVRGAAGMPVGRALVLSGWLRCCRTRSGWRPRVSAACTAWSSCFRLSIRFCRRCSTTCCACWSTA
jgi:hypothetical protein